MLVIIVTVVLLEMSQCGCSLYLNIFVQCTKFYFYVRGLHSKYIKKLLFLSPFSHIISSTSFTFGL